LGDASGFGDEETTANNSEGLSETILAWRIIETWTTENHVDLNASLADPCTRADIAAAEADLGIQFPATVRASLRLHDGQEDLDSLTGAGGLFYGMPLMALDEIAQMTKTWRTVAERIELDQKVKQNIAARQQLISPTGSSTELNNEINRSSASLVETKPGYDKVNTAGSTPDLELQKKISTTQSNRFKSHIPTQRSVPPGAIQPVYAHPMWIPLITDLAGNHVGVDLAPGPQGKWGQVIVFGRDFDTKFVLADHWGDFLLMFAKDLESGNYDLVQVVDDVLGGDGELVFKDKRSGREVAYMRVLTDRAIHRYRSQNPQPVRQQQQQKQQEEKPFPKQPPQPIPKERIVSEDITSKNKENEPVKEDKKAETVEVVEDADDELDLALEEVADPKKIDEEVTNDFKEIRI
jgi:cell wall assembly regulator SMI1